MTWVLEHSEARLSDRLVLLALAEYAHDDGGMAFPSVNTLARKARIGESTCQASLRRLEAQGEIEKMGKTRYGTIIYRVLMGAAPDSEGSRIEGGPESRGVQNLEEGVQNLESGGPESRPNPLVEPSVTVKGSNAGAQARDEVPGLRIGGRPVKARLWELTDQVLAAYNLRSGSKLRLLTSAGKPSKAAIRVYSRIKEYPDISFEEHDGIIERTLASRWWGQGSPTIGVVYGPNVFEDNIARPGSSNGANGKHDRDRSRLAAMQRLMEEQV